MTTTNITLAAAVVIAVAAAPFMALSFAPEIARHAFRGEDIM